MPIDKVAKGYACDFFDSYSGWERDCRFFEYSIGVETLVVVIINLKDDDIDGYHEMAIMFAGSDSYNLHQRS